MKSTVRELPWTWPKLITVPDIAPLIVPAGMQLGWIVIWPVSADPCCVNTTLNSPEVAENLVLVHVPVQAPATPDVALDEDDDAGADVGAADDDADADEESERTVDAWLEVRGVDPPVGGRDAELLHAATRATRATAPHAVVRVEWVVVRFMADPLGSVGTDRNGSECAVWPTLCEHETCAGGSTWRS